ncbi:VOC family protein [Paenibacillus sp. sptzw28]|uniref:VOC family protein n=1 Tax=Paenibacillus sp. sptzw28 TaxID=715179 RepID=UPI001C6E1AF6|nr:VOC family protein [Paenibacillus sp. sptzw28]QYR22718.1 VOC family protein [Paenibacillus sp. sptzw28]
MGIKTVIHHQVPVSHLENAAQWYVNILGFELERPINSESKMAFLHLPDRGAAVHLIQTDDKTRLRISTEDKDNYIIGFYCENISELQQKLTDSGSPATLEDAGGCGWWLYFCDIDGNRYFAAEDK